MKALLKIGYTTYLVREIETATKILNLLSGAVEIDDRLYENRIILRDSEPLIEVKVVPSSAVVVRKRQDGGEEPVVDVSPRRKLRGTNRTALLGLPGS